MKYLLFFIIFSNSIIFAQPPKLDKKTIQRGYIIYLGTWGWFFQPSCKERISLYQSLDKKSFRIRYGSDGYNNVLRSFEETSQINLMYTDIIFFNQKNDTTNYVDQIKYEYVEITFKKEKFSNIERISPCKLSISLTQDRKKNYPLFCCSFEVEIYEIKRLEK